jgi:hypothetical protein
MTSSQLYISASKTKLTTSFPTIKLKNLDFQIYTGLMSLTLVEIDKQPKWTRFQSSRKLSSRSKTNYWVIVKSTKRFLIKLEELKQQSRKVSPAKRALVLML